MSEPPHRGPGPIRSVRLAFRDQRGPALLFLAGTAPLIAWAGLRGNGRAGGYLLVFGSVVPLTCWLSSRVRFSRTAWWLLAVLGVLHAVGGLLPSPQADAPIFYETWLIAETLKYDQLVHGFGGGVLGLAGWQIMRHVARSDADLGVLLVGAVLIANGVGALNEIVEFAIAGRAIETWVGGLSNASWDMVFNLAGSLTSAVLLYATERSEPAVSAEPSASR